jgi:molybdenum cofactor guanylyltransferase
MTRAVVAGVLVGGAATRMNGVAKGLLMTQDGMSIVQRTCTVFTGLSVPCVLVGRRSEYDALGLPQLDDALPGIGPLGGALALLRHAATGWAVLVACDMPFVTPELARRLLEAPDAPAVAPRSGGRWQPMFARYDAARALPVAERLAREGRHSMHGLLTELGAHELSLSPDEERALVDWDTPADVGARAPR